MFVKYNIKDVLLCYKLEEKNKDVFLFYLIAEMTRTRLAKAMKKTISIKNLAYKFAMDRGYVMGNNINIKYSNDNANKEEIKEKFEGALVADPNLNKAVGKEIMGRLSRYIHELVIDFDLSSLYPSIFMAHNISVSTQYGRLYIMLKKDDKHNYGKTEGRDLGGELLEDLSTMDYNNIAIKHHNLSSTDMLIKKVIQKQKQLKSVQ